MTTATRILCVTEHEHRSRAIADGVLAGRFTVAGETRALGTRPDWLGASLPDDEEWRIEWVKFAWGLDLAHAAEQTGDPAYALAWERLTRSHAEQVPPDASNKSIERWDSMGHLLVVLELEQAFETQLSPEQTEQMTSIPAIAAIIDAA